MPHYQVWIDCYGDQDEFEQLDWQWWQSLSPEERKRREQEDAQAIDLFYAGIWEAPDESAAKQLALDWIREKDISVVPGA